MLTSCSSLVTRLAPCMAGHTQVWRASLQNQPSALELDRLASTEHAKAQRFVHEVHRRRYLAARVALRGILAMETGMAPRDIPIDYGPFGKPMIDARFGIYFNVSHCNDVALVAVSRKGEVGVDIECPRAIADALDIARVHFSPAEREQLSEYSERRSEQCLSPRMDSKGSMPQGHRVWPGVSKLGLGNRTMYRTPDGFFRPAAPAACGRSAILRWARFRNIFGRIVAGRSLRSSRNCSSRIAARMSTCVAEMIRTR